ncbi:E2-like conjugating enzyme atg10 [Pyricularia grisea]|uniref:Ubiquitin-like-conjugating enzyme ATG10 n=1 Tax=Pyricularia grisea TaxID=148305 RepID=A0A6P8B9D6_PYRGI|nr:uncharacterized protein PgNI_04970 [Pyricularia grisea]KAI6372420.1 E2-like conjugating enzyme atg10 [Pyricularia grisea]TLD12448.1 hypothetical protein PgNI_04970 [Pyricularia grisea]
MSTFSTGKSSEFKNYPFLTAEEFGEICHHLDRKYCQAFLGPVRQQWRLNVLTALETSFVFGADYSTYLQIVRPLTRELELDDGGLSDQLGGFSLESQQAETWIAGDQGMVDLEDADEYAVIRQSRAAESPSVTYEVHLHPTYRTPCLWFSLSGLPADEPMLDVETVFRRLVPDEFKARLRNQGPIAAISADHHPITGVPTFFIHPCLLGEAMSNFDCSKEDYLMVWLGLVGGCVGLWVPREMASL